MTNTMQESAKYTPKRIRADRELVDAMRSLPPERSLNDYECGCKIMRESAGAIYMRWCPAHKAAPELLEALAMCYEAIAGESAPDRLMNASERAAADAARTAIQKATGG